MDDNSDLYNIIRIYIIFIFTDSITRSIKFEPSQMHPSLSICEFVHEHILESSHELSNRAIHELVCE